MKIINKMDFSNNYGGLYDFSAKIPFNGMPQATPLGALYSNRHKMYANKEFNTR